MALATNSRVEHVAALRALGGVGILLLPLFLLYDHDDHKSHTALLLTSLLLSLLGLGAIFAVAHLRICAQPTSKTSSKPTRETA